MLLGSPCPLCTTAIDPPQVFPKEKTHRYSAEPLSCPELIPDFLGMQRKQQGTAGITLKL